MIIGLGEDTLASLLGTSTSKESETFNGILESDTKRSEESQSNQPRIENQSPIRLTFAE